MQFGNNFVAVALVDEEALALAREAHLKRVLRHESVEEGVVLLGDGAFFGAQDATQPLRFLAS